MTRPRTDSEPRTSEAGFTLLELIIVVGIISILAVVVMIATDRAKASGQAKAMTVIGADVGKAVSTYNRMNPPIRTDRVLAGATWTSTQTEAAGGLYSTTGERLLQPWPENPYANADVVIRRGATCPTTATPGTVAVCRVAGASRSSLRVRAWARDRNGTSYVVYDQRLG